MLFSLKPKSEVIYFYVRQGHGHYKCPGFPLKGQTFLKCYTIVFLLPVSHTVFSFEVFLCVYLLPNLFIYYYVL